MSCPVCGDPIVYTTRCMPQTRRCARGHEHMLGYNGKVYPMPQDPAAASWQFPPPNNPDARPR